jgi:hypothetical protein
MAAGVIRVPPRLMPSWMRDQTSAISARRAPQMSASTGIDPTARRKLTSTGTSARPASSGGVRVRIE